MRALVPSIVAAIFQASSTHRNLRAVPGVARSSARQLPLRRPQIENSLQGKILRRWLFLYRFMLARAHSDAIGRLEPLLQEFFEHEWVADVRVRLRFLPGAEDRELKIPWPGNKYLLRLRWLPWRKQACPAHWGAPVTVSVSKTNSGEMPKTVRYMSLFIQEDALHIVQLQGVPLIEMPKGLRDWAERFVRACMEYARRENLRAVKLARPDSLYSYHNPSIRWYFTPEQRVETLKKIRAGFEKHHDGTARILGFTPETDWFCWDNPDFRRLGNFPPNESLRNAA
jgi:hypothetical protein